MLYFNIKDYNLADVDFFTDIHLDKINVYSITLVTLSNDFDLLVAKFTLLMRKYSSIQMIQQISDDFIRFTFVSHLNCIFFYRHLSKIVHELELVYNCKIKIL